MRRELTIDSTRSRSGRAATRRRLVSVDMTDLGLFIEAWRHTTRDLHLLLARLEPADQILRSLAVTP